MSDNARRLRTARDNLHKLEDRGIVENNLTMEQITAIRIAEFAIDEICSTDVQPVNQWISVKDKLPEVGQPVLIYYPYWTGLEVQVARLEYDKLTFDICGEFNASVNKVTHWQPLPEAPETKKRYFNALPRIHDEQED